KPKQVVVQVKSGHVKSGDVRELVGVLEREKAAIGVFITLEAPTSEMVTEAVKAGKYVSPGWGREYRRVQILTIEQLLRGAKVDMPPGRPRIRPTVVAWGCCRPRIRRLRSPDTNTRIFTPRFACSWVIRGPQG
ncbi:MAG: restriction endonuclease, partial [Anaerolineae bacterium]|nr:restriction endonuclease [Anaerolineae bacterium]